MDEMNRRRFVQTVGAAGMFGGFAGLGGQAPGGDDFPKPAGLRPGAQLDSRFPVSFATPVSEGMRLMVEYFTALSQRDVQGMSRLLHFRSRSTRTSSRS
jgi:hypothetical protein